MSLATRFAVFVLLLAPLPLVAGGKAVIEVGQGSDRAHMQVEYDDAGALRMEAGQLGHSYTLLRDGNLYSVTDQPGQPPRVIDMAAMMRLAGNMAATVNHDPLGATDEVAAITRLHDTGRTETVAGIQGRVHQLTYTDEAGSQETVELVLSDDRRVRDMQRAMQAMGLVMARAIGQVDAAEANLLQERLDDTGQGMLRYGDQYRLVEVSGQTPPASRFQLPAEPMAIPGMEMLGRMDGAEREPRQPGLVDEKIQRQPQRVENRTEREVDRASDRAVDKAVDRAVKGLKGLFGG